MQVIVAALAQHVRRHLRGAQRLDELEKAHGAEVIFVGLGERLRRQRAGGTSSLGLLARTFDPQAGGADVRFGIHGERTALPW